MQTRRGMSKAGEYFIGTTAVVIFLAALGAFGYANIPNIPPEPEFRQWEHVYHALSTKRKPIRGIVVETRCYHPVFSKYEGCDYMVRFADSYLKPQWYQRRELFNRVEWTQYLANAIQVK